MAPQRIRSPPKLTIRSSLLTFFPVETIRPGYCWRRRRAVGNRHYFPLLPPFACNQTASRNVFFQLATTDKNCQLACPLCDEKKRDRQRSNSRRMIRPQFFSPFHCSEKATYPVPIRTRNQREAAPLSSSIVSSLSVDILRQCAGEVK